MVGGRWNVIEAITRPRIDQSDSGLSERGVQFVLAACNIRQHRLALAIRQPRESSVDSRQSIAALPSLRYAVRSDTRGNAAFSVWPSAFPPPTTHFKLAGELR